jgi:DNA-binding LacI/PurR family transcriptional regulator
MIGRPGLSDTSSGIAEAVGVAARTAGAALGNSGAVPPLEGATKAQAARQLNYGPGRGQRSHRAAGGRGVRWMLTLAVRGIGSTGVRG